jgi:hypothetical protein
VDLDELMVATYCLRDAQWIDLTGGQRVRQRGPEPTVTDADVLTIAVVGELLGLDQDAAISRSVRHHSGAWFAALRAVHRTTFVRRAANVWFWKEQRWQSLATRIPHDPPMALIDSVPLLVCRVARAKRCRLFGGAAAFGHDAGARQTLYGFRCHVRLE